MLRRGKQVRRYNAARRVAQLYAVFPLQNFVPVLRFSPIGMDIKAVITTINQMQADGVVERYAVGGAVGATFYLEPVATLDVESL